MSIEVRPLGSTCNLRCEYCYEETERQAHGEFRYNREAVLATLKNVGAAFTIFGGEPLMLPIPQLEELLMLSCQKFGHSGIQTNGNLITDEHIEMFIRCKTHVGISIDGPGELNDARWAGNVESTRKQTKRTEVNLKKLISHGKTHPFLLPSLIVTLHAGNVGKTAFPKFISWLRELDALGVQHINLHDIENDYKAEKWLLPIEEYIDRFIDLWELQSSFCNIKFQMFREIITLLSGGDKDTVCIWRACDPYNSDSVRGIEHDGTPSFCTRSVKDGKLWLPAEGCGTPDHENRRNGFPATRHYERQLALYVTPQDLGGCKDCPYWILCQGSCPGTSMQRDWRMRTVLCPLIKRLFAHGEAILRKAGIPIVTDWINCREIENELYKVWSNNGRGDWVRIARELKCVTNQTTQSCDSPGDRAHGDCAHGDAHGDSAHGDSVHGDSGHKAA